MGHPRSGRGSRATLLVMLGLVAGCQSDESAQDAARGLRFDEVVRDYSALPELLHFTARDGGQLAYRHYPAGQPDAPSMVLIHGSGYHSRYLMPMAQSLAAAGTAHVYTPDLRGHGPSPERRGDIDYVEQLEDDLADLLKVIRAARPDAPIVVAGHSSGGGLALRFAGSRHGGQADAYVLLAPFLHHAAPTTRSDGGGWARPKVARIVALSLAAGLGLTWLQDTIVIEFNMPRAFRDGSETLAYSYRLNTGFAPRDYLADLRAVRVPLLVLAGADDETFVAAEYPAAIGEGARAAEVTLLPGVSHMGVAVGPQAATHVGEWLRKLPR